TPRASCLASAIPGRTEIHIKPLVLEMRGPCARRRWASRPIPGRGHSADNRCPSPVERADPTMLEQIEELLGAEEPTLARMEDTLTEGYAQALALEAERWRLERRIGEVARDGGATDIEELRSLGTRLSHADGELATLRTLLGRLHERARLVRRALQASATAARP